LHFRLPPNGGCVDRAFYIASCGSRQAFLAKDYSAVKRQLLLPFHLKKNQVAKGSAACAHLFRVNRRSHVEIEVHVWDNIETTHSLSHCPHRSLMPRFWIGIIFVFALLGDYALGADRISFDRVIRPILSENCFHCHGPDQNQRKADLRLDVPDAFDPQVVAERIANHTGEERMPPVDSGKNLTEEQRSLLLRWIEQGAEYQVFWAFAPLTRPELPEPIDSQLGADHPIDRFVSSNLNQRGRSISKEASKFTLIRRLSFDLTGLPPTPNEIDAFVSDTSQDAYERLVDRLLASPQYGERMAVDWLDMARYADTNGYQVDRNRELWAWRDWVVQAFNSNMPFNQFTIEQLAGDLLPNATVPQRIATGFHRNHMLNEEGGIIDAEFLAEYTADRVETTASVWLGQTFQCARCHDHKYDPFTQRDFYSMKAFFHNVSEKGVGIYSSPIRRNAPPYLQLSTPELDQKVALAVKNRDAAIDALETYVQEVRRSWKSDLSDEQRKAEQKTLEANPRYRELNAAVAKLKKEVQATEDAIPTTLIMSDDQPRKTYILERGAYDKPGIEVFAATPAVLPPLKESWPRNRLGLAYWLVDNENPLTARVAVNRYWQQFFGTGIVRTSEDFGTQGELPSHPELLDWLSVQFRETGWDIKQLIRLIVTSRTYRQQSHRDATAAEVDKDNRFLTRGPRNRLMAEMIRDQALFTSGLLSTRIGGPSVRPYHPSGLYEQITAGTGYNVYEPGKDEELYRRSMYTYWKRSVPHPAMLAFDAPFRESCTVRRSRSNTALQALNLMNDPTYVEAARFVAMRVLAEGGPTLEDRLSYAVKLLLSRMSSHREMHLLGSAYSRSLADFSKDKKSAVELLEVGTRKLALEYDASELAAMTMVAMTLMNLDEAISK
jgi:hypothetical protein